MSWRAVRHFHSNVLEARTEHAMGSCVSSDRTIDRFENALCKKLCLLKAARCASMEVTSGGYLLSIYKKSPTLFAHSVHWCCFARLMFIGSVCLFSQTAFACLKNSKIRCYLLSRSRASGRAVWETSQQKHSDAAFCTSPHLDRLLDGQRTRPWLLDSAGEQELLRQLTADILEPHVWQRWCR